MAKYTRISETGKSMTTRELFTNVYPIQDKKLLSELIQCTSVKDYKKNDLIFKQEETDTNICFLNTGVVAAYEIYPNGRTICSRICDKAGDVLVGGMGPNAPYSPVNIRMVTDGTVFVIPMLKIRRFQENYPEIMLFYNAILMDEYEKLWQVNNMLYLESAEDRYNWFLSHYPGTIDKVNHNIIASFLRMSQVTICRVRKRNEGKTSQANTRTS